MIGHAFPPWPGGRPDAVGEFHLSASAACGSVLPTDPANKFWCHDHKRVAHVPVVSLASFFKLLDPALLERGHHLLKVDTEGADLLVLRGAGSDALRRYFRGVVIECAFGDYAGPVFNKQGRPVQPPPPAKRFTHHTGECNVPAALDFMRAGFPHQHVVVQGGTANVFFGRAAEDVAAMKGLLRSID